MSKELFSSFKNTPEVFIQESARIGDQFITVSVPLNDLDARCILLPCGVSIGIQDDTTPVEPVTEEAKAVEMLAGAMVADLVMDSYPAVLLHKRVEQVRDDISKMYLEAWLSQSSLDLRAYILS